MNDIELARYFNAARSIAWINSDDLATSHSAELSGLHILKVASSIHSFASCSRQTNVGENLNNMRTRSDPSNNDEWHHSMLLMTSRPKPLQTSSTNDIALYTEQSKQTVWARIERIFKISKSRHLSIYHRDMASVDSAIVKIFQECAQLKSGLEA